LCFPSFHRADPEGQKRVVSDLTFFERQLRLRADSSPSKTASADQSAKGIPLWAVKAISRWQWNDGVDDARAASGSMKRRAKMVVVGATV
jgi:hypothetical protein